MLEITTEFKGLEQALKAIALLSSDVWITNTLRTNKAAFSQLEREHYQLVGKTTRYSSPKRAGDDGWGVDTGALFRDLTNNIQVDGASLRIGSDIVYGAALEELLGRKKAQGQAQESSLLPSEDELYALLEPLIVAGVDAIWNGN